jgi:hypothetical protein
VFLPQKPDQAAVLPVLLLLVLVLLLLVDSGASWSSPLLRCVALVASVPVCCLCGCASVAGPENMSLLSKSRACGQTAQHNRQRLLHQRAKTCYARSCNVWRSRQVQSSSQGAWCR